MKTFKRILTYLKPFRVRLIFAVLAMIANVVTNIAGTFMLSIAINDYILPLFKHEYVSFGALTGIAALGGFVAVMASIYLFGAFLQYISHYVIIGATTKVLENVRNEMFEKMEKLPIKYFDTHTHGDIMSLYTNDTDTLRELLSNGLPNLITNACTILGMFIAMLILSPLLTLVSVAMLAIMLLITKTIAGKSGKHFVLQQRQVGALNGFIEEHMDGLKVVKVFCHEQEEKADFDSHNQTLRGASKKAHTYANVLMPIMGNLSYVSYAITAIVGTILTINGFGGMNWGKLVSFMQYSRQFSNPLSQIAQQMNGILMALAGAERIFELIDQEPEQDEGYVKLVNAREDEDGNMIECEEYTGMWAWKHYHKATDTTTFVKWRGEVEFENVSFGYDPEKTVLKNVTFEAKPGQKFALVGSTGAGKTTITNLINRFYDINEGKIRYDDINITKINKQDLRHSMAMVLQDTHLFTGTVRDNIRFGKLDATDEEVENAAKLTNADYFIRHLPDGYDTMLTGDGTNLSQGQRQLLAIARAAVANPPVLVLDEATSSIDTRTEKLIEQGMDGLMKGRTVFVIAHRLSTVRNADVILVLEHGEIIERGNHDELIALKGKYYQLYTGAFELD
ncbi:MAG: ABC transporter ATP-binding protein [Clostridia bacterium]|nr:ABC transporter ATP-binding protein [Clostridia bacterium]